MPVRFGLQKFGPRTELKPSEQLSKFGRDYTRFHLNLIGVLPSNEHLRELANQLRTSDKRFEVGRQLVQRDLPKVNNLKVAIERLSQTKDFRVMKAQLGAINAHLSEVSRGSEKPQAGHPLAPTHLPGYFASKFGSSELPTLRNYCYWFNRTLREGGIGQKDFEIAEKTANAIVAMRIIPLREKLLAEEKSGNLPGAKATYKSILEYVAAVQSLKTRTPPPLFADAVRQKKVAAARRDLKLFKRTGAIK
jgi:hypothetical protein